jgi:hypothetical protein
MKLLDAYKIDDELESAFTEAQRLDEAWFAANADRNYRVRLPPGPPNTGAIAIVRRGDLANIMFFAPNMYRTAKKLANRKRGVDKLLTEAHTDTENGELFEALYSGMARAPYDGSVH